MGLGRSERARAVSCESASRETGACLHYMLILQSKKAELVLCSDACRPCIKSSQKLVATKTIPSYNATGHRHIDWHIKISGIDRQIQ